MRLIPLANGQSAIVDDRDYAACMKHRWMACDMRYPKAQRIVGKKQPEYDGVIRRQYLHQFIMDLRPCCLTTFLNNNSLDCRRSNMVISCTNPIKQVAIKAELEAKKKKRDAFRAVNPVKHIISQTSKRTNYLKARSNPQYVLKKAMRSRIYMALMHQGVVKRSKTMDMVGMDVHQFKDHIKKKWKKGMTWENYGSVWHLDHIVPVNLYDLTNPEHVKRCFHYSNYQPLSAFENQSKSDNLFWNQVA